MTDNQLQWLLSLSAVSMLGPKLDIDQMSAKGFYRKIKPNVAYLEQHISVHQNPYKVYQKEITSFLKLWEVVDKSSYKRAVNTLMEGSEFGINIHRLVELGRTMTLDDRNVKRTFLINGHPYLYDIFSEVMTYEHHFPKAGFLAYDLANVVMLLRLGKCYGYISEQEQMTYFEEILLKGTGEYSNYKQFGIDASLSRNIHEKHLGIIESGFKNELFKPYLSIAYYGIWQWFESINLSNFI